MVYWVFDPSAGGWYAFSILEKSLGQRSTLLPKGHRRTLFDTHGADCVFPRYSSGFRALPPWNNYSIAQSPPNVNTFFQKICWKFLPNRPGAKPTPCGPMGFALPRPAVPFPAADLLSPPISSATQGRVSRLRRLVHIYIPHNRTPCGRGHRVGRSCGC